MDSANPTTAATWLGRSYPNPSNPTTVIPFHVGKEAQAQIKTYDVVGRLVRVLFYEKLDPRTYHVTWDGKNSSGARVPSGVHFYRLTVGTRHLEGRAIVLK